MNNHFKKDTNVARNKNSHEMHEITLQSKNNLQENLKHYIHVSKGGNLAWITEVSITDFIQK